MAGLIRRVLALNAGSSSLKWALFDGEARTAGATIGDTDAGAAVGQLVGDLAAHGAPPEAVGHRVVHGGPHLTADARVDDGVIAALRKAAPFAPLHLPAQIRALEAATAAWPSAPQVACFDTSFHATLPEEATRLPIAEKLHAAGVRRYGFHGLSYEYVVSAVGAEALGRAVIAHLGSGSSLAAIEGGRSIDTTMGLTPLGGVMMGTRPGDLDPGVVLHLLTVSGYDARAVEHTFDRESGLLGVSGRTADMRALLEARAAGDARADLAVRMYCRSVRKAVGALATVLGGLDTLVFTAGIGEHAAAIRAEIARGLEPLGARVDEARNAAHAALISPDGAGCTVRVVRTDEEIVIARHVRSVLTIHG